MQQRVVGFLKAGNRPIDVSNQSLAFIETFGQEGLLPEDRARLKNWATSIANLDHKVGISHLSQKEDAKLFK